MTKDLHQEFLETILYKSKISLLQITTSRFLVLRTLGSKLDLLVILRDLRDQISISKIKFMKVYKVG
jgi:DNA-binding MarR family transcriptional regulator